MSDKEFYNDLTLTYTYIESLLIRYSKETNSYLHTPTLITTRLDGRPTARTIILRKYDAKNRCLEFYTDKRANKFLEIEKSGLGQLHFYSYEHLLQLRIDCELEVKLEKILLQEAWNNLPERSKQVYQQSNTCGGQLASPEELTIELEEKSAGFKNFAIVAAKIQSIECLYLHSPQHRRSFFSWQCDALESSWLAP